MYASKFEAVTAQFVLSTVRTISSVVSGSTHTVITATSKVAGFFCTFTGIVPSLPNNWSYRVTRARLLLGCALRHFGIERRRIERWHLLQRIGVFVVGR